MSRASNEYTRSFAECFPDWGEPGEFQLLEYQSEIFGVTLARARIESPEQIPRFEAFCRERGVALAIARAAVDFRLIGALEDAGYRTMEIMLRMSMRFPLAEEYKAKASEQIVVRRGEARDADFAAPLARRTYTATSTHYSVNPHLSVERIGDYYEEFVHRSFVEGHVSFIAEVDGEPIAFLLTETSQRIMYTQTVGIDERIRNRFGLLAYVRLLRVAAEWAEAHGAVKMYGGVGIWNRPIMTALYRAGCKPEQSEVTLHRWYGGHEDAGAPR